MKKQSHRDKPKEDFTAATTRKLSKSLSYYKLFKSIVFGTINNTTHLYIAVNDTFFGIVC